MKKFFTKLLLVIVPLLIVVATYVFTDPFRVIYHYGNFYDPAQKYQVYKNRDYISTETFRRNYSQQKYNSYIFGSSRSEVYEVKVWEKYINSNACFHYNAHRESLFGVEKKFEFLHRQGVKIRNALIVVDYELLAATSNYTDPVFRKHPLITNEGNFAFQLSEFKPYIFLFSKPSYLKWLLKQPQYPFSYNALTNEECWWGNLETAIAGNRDSFYQARSKAFYRRDTLQQYANRVIKEEQVNMLTRIKEIMAGDKTEYRIIINPLYDQRKTDTTDLRLLQSIFGSENVLDFSGINEITCSKYNYYEASHFRPQVATRLIDIAYTPKKPNP